MAAKIYPDSEKVIGRRVHSSKFILYEIMVLIISLRSDWEGSGEYAHMCILAGAFVARIHKIWK